MEKIRVWTRIAHAQYDEWKLAEADNPAAVPACAVKAFNRVFWKMRGRGVFFPLDELAAYQAGLLALFKAADALARGSVKLTKCSPATYLIAAGVMRLRQFRREEVNAARESSRRLDDLCRDGECDLHAIAEALPDMGRAAAAESRTLAAHCVAETLGLCRAETRRALGAYLRCALNAKRTAAELSVPYATFVWRRDHVWFPDFRGNCKWRW